VVRLLISRIGRLTRTRVHRRATEQGLEEWLTLAVMNLSLSLSFSFSLSLSLSLSFSLSLPPSRPRPVVWMRERERARERGDDAPQLCALHEQVR